MIKLFRRILCVGLLINSSLLFSGAQLTNQELDSQSNVEVENESTKATFISNSFPVDLSFPTIDIKYNSEKGVQILEFNTGIRSGYKGASFINDDPYMVAKKFVETVEQYHNQVWYYPHHILNPGLRKVFKKSSFQALARDPRHPENKKFKTAAQLPVYNPQNILDYHGVYLGNTKSLEELEEFRKNYPGIIPLSAALIKFRAGKGKLNDFLSSHESLNSYKPLCGQFKKVYTPGLAQKILEEIGCEIVVIKPWASTQGNGVIIVHQDDLDETLQYIFSGSEELKNDKDISYRWWAKDKRENFVVEEFVASDTIYVPHLDSKPYDGTMRVVVFLAYNNEEITIHFLEKYWKLPLLSLDEEGTLNQKHKSKARGNNFSSVSDDVWESVESQLREALISLYSITLFEG